MADKNIGENFLSLLDSLEPKNVGKQRGHQDGSENENRREIHQRNRGNRESFRGIREGSREGENNNWRNKKTEENGGNNSQRKNVRREMRTREEGGKGEEQMNFRSDSATQSEKCESHSKRRGNSSSGKLSRNADSNVPKMMGYKFLESLLDRDLSYVLPTLASSRGGFQELVNDRPMRPDLLLLIVRVLNRVSESEIHHLKVQILSQTLRPEFIDEIKKYASLICIEDNKQRLLTVSVFFRNVLSLFESIINLFPSMMNEKFKNLSVALNLSMKNARDVQGIDISDILFDQLTSLSNQVISYIESKMKLDKEQKKTKIIELTAPNDFRELPLIPTEDDFRCDKAFLRPNIIKGSYRDVDHYLDVQFRLLREDFIAPLRVGIYEYIESITSPHLKRRFSNVRIYHKVQFVQSHKSRDTFGYTIRFDCDKKLPRNMNWEFSKRFMVGSLLLLTDNGFQTFFLATVAERNIDRLQDGYLFIALVPGTDVPDYLFEHDVFFVMAESEVYYEAYRHVLLALKRMNEKNFPMKQYIVEVDTASFPPSYLVNNREYKILGYNVDVLDECSWPTPDQLKLNPSQHQAFKSALTNDFVVIQGPPGTGKTFLALKVTEVLLKNKVSDDGPIVVICYTNHALDQFLEGILEYTKNLIRIGSRSQNEALEKYNIDQVRKEKKMSRQFNLSTLYREAIDEKMYLQNKLLHIQKKIEELGSPRGILELSVLRSVVTPQQYNELKDHEVEWLCYGIENMNTEEDEIQASGRSGDVAVSDGKDKSGELFENLNEFQEEKELEKELEEELNDDENARRLADMTEDDFFEEDFIREENYSSSVTYILKFDGMLLAMSELAEELNESTLPLDHPERFYLETNTRESIKEIGWRLNFIQTQYLQLANFKFDPVKFESFQNMTSVWEINESNRWEYYLTWIHLYICQLKQTIKFITESYQEVLLKLYELKQLEDLVFVKQADVIGLTTSGAAKRRVLLENLNTKIVIVEEAAEVLEAHIVTSLTKSVQHVILIGDHKQLRPNPAVFELAKKYNLNVSLFERMLHNGLNCSILGVQHRMRPEIASLIVPTVYPTLANHPSTLNRPKISGIDKFVFFLTHSHPEDQLPDSSSKQNKHESDFLLQLCEYLLLQGYKPEEITILTTYAGQVWCMRKDKRRRMNQKPEWKFVRITPVDNFQGEENRIILLSLVRSNKENKIGFLSTENRVCVALSRAKEGLYIIGNMDNLTASSSIWPKIKQQLEEINAVGTYLTLRCERHPAQISRVATAKDFNQVPEGGCSLMCKFELNCGHECPRVCHIIDKDHAFFQCMQPCQRPPCDVEGHRCPLCCWKPCEPCKVPVTKQLPCGHSAKLRCHEEPALVPCQEQVPVTLPACKHEGFKPCSMDVEECKCNKPCPFRLPCGHACTRQCHVNNDPDHITYLCLKPCTKQNTGCKKNHTCPKSCYEPCGDCSVLVLTKLDCGHSESIECSKDPATIQCKKLCKIIMECGHKCKLQCWLPCKMEMCIELVEKVRSCGHIIKKIKCNESPESFKCSAKCTRLLACGHPCPDKCFNDCSKILCQVLVPSCVLPACGHPAIQIPCHLNKPDLQRGSDELVQLCQAPCRADMMCGHQCKGTCGNCMQGRLHIPCGEKCNKVLICGHRCNSTCNVLCPPCSSKKCFNICNHWKCTQIHICNTPCHPCTRPCLWACKHLKCTKQCGEECNRPVCNVRCTDLLPCGHQCAGFCGEPHPLVCPTCDEEDMDELAFEFDYYRFVVLEDCDHIVKASIMEDLLKASTEHGVTRLLQCPQCQNPVVRTMRYRTFYNQFRKHLIKLNKSVLEESARLRKMIMFHVDLLKSSPTTSPTMNRLLMECSQMTGANMKMDMGRLLTGSLLIPLVVRYRESKDIFLHQPLDPLKEQRLRFRLEYLATSLRPRLRQISHTDILQIELEVARILHALNPTTSNNVWYDVTSFTWVRASTTQMPLRMSTTLRTRDGTKHWYQCHNQHFYVSENNEPCVTCQDEEEERKQREEQKRLREERALEDRTRNSQREDRVHTKFQQIPVTDYRKKGRGRGRGGRGGGGGGGGRGRGRARGQGHRY